MGDKKNFNTIVKYIREKLQINPDCSFCLLFSRKDVKDNFDEYITNEELFDIINNNKLLISTVSNYQGIEGDHSIIYLNHKE